MTQLQKLAWLNLFTAPAWIGIVWLDRHAPKLALAGIVLVLGASLGLTILMARKPWQKAVEVDERDHLIRQRSMTAAYLSLLGCLAASMFTALVVYGDRPIPIRVFVEFVGLSYVASVTALAASALIQYGRGVKSAAD